MKNYQWKITAIFVSFVLGVVFVLINPFSVLAATVSVTGKAKVLNTNNSYLDFTNYNANVSIDDSNGNFSGYAFLEDMGWVAFGTTDNSLGPVSINLVSGAVTGKAKVLNTGAYLDFSNYSSNVSANITTGVFSGYVFSEDVGWIDFADTGVSSAATLDAVAPLAFDLISPGNNSYTTNERPTFKWKATTDATSGMSKYKLEIDNGETGDFTIDDIPVSRTTDYKTNKYLIHYENFDDSDSTNDYISVYTKSSLDWKSSENDGKLKEGKRGWKVKAIDNVGNEREAARTLFVDRSRPSVELTQINETAFADHLATTDRTPTIFGKITDSLAGDKSDNYVASGPEKIEIKIEKRSFLGLYNLHTLSTVNLNENYWTGDGSKITDNSKNTSHKYSPFSYTPADDLLLGTYRITFTGKDKVNNDSNILSFTLTIRTFEEIVEILEVEKTTEEIEEIMKDGGIVVPEELKEPSKITEAIGKIFAAAINLWWKTVDTGKFLAGKIGSVFAFINEKTDQGFAFAGNKIKNSALAITNTIRKTTKQFLAFRKQKIKKQRMALAKVYSNLAQKAPGIIKEGLLAIARGIDTANKTVGNAANKMTNKVKTLASNMGKRAQSIGQAIGQKTSKLATAWRTSLESISKPASEEAQALTGRLKVATSTFVAIVFDKEPTKISEVKVTEVGQDYAIITWKTNHYATSKVNYGETFDYGKDVQSDKRVKEHKIKITDLKPGTKYCYEVMSQNKNYVFDARHEFSTPLEK